MPYRPRHSRAEWQALIDEFTGLDVSARQFCAERNLGYASFLRWRRLLSESVTDLEPPAPAFVDLSSLAASPQAAGWRITLDLGQGVVLHLERH